MKLKIRNRYKEEIKRLKIKVKELEDYRRGMKDAIFLGCKNG